MCLANSKMTDSECGEHFVAALIVRNQHFEKFALPEFVRLGYDPPLIAPHYFIR